MSEYAHDESSPPRHGSDANLQNSLDDSANNSIIGKVKSRVSSILPNRLSKWFSPSAKLQNDSLNGSIGGENTTQPTRRRRRIEIEEEENYGDDTYRAGERKESNYRIYAKQEQNRDHEVDDENDDDDDDSQNSEDEYICGSLKQSKRDLNIESQPPAKRSRLNIDVRDSPIIARHQPLLSSTPATGSPYVTTSASRNTCGRFTYLNLYGNQSKQDPAFNFGQQIESKSTAKRSTDIIDLITNSNYENEDKFEESSNIFGGNRTGINSRKSLNIPSSTAITGSERVYATVANLKRQPLSSAKAALSSTNVGVPPRRTSTTIQEVDDQEAGDGEKTLNNIDKGVGIVSETNMNTYNGSIEGSKNFSTNKRQKLINGSSLNVAALVESNEGISVDSASESDESATDVIKRNSSNSQRKTGLFNMSAGGNTNTRNSSRTSSFGNGLNFFSHLEGRKSLFSGPNHANPLNNSTLSLTSLNRRQFNASIYGSTSALSDSRLLNTFSPFYKGKTTYGGAAAYNKYTASASASTVRITPTLIRPTSSLSTLSTSSNPLTNNVNSQMGENSAISSTAKRILDLINDFATPLSEAKKMASNLKTNSYLNIPQAKCRLNESDINASRAIRLSQVRSPYSRSTVILQPSGNASGQGAAGGLLPPVRELQVPTMSQLLQMKKMQNITEKARKIVQKSASNSGVSDYTLPEIQSSKTKNTDICEQDQQKHTNKIKNKITKPLRASGISKGLLDEEPPPPVNLPNISFPQMQSVPKIDIELNKPSDPSKSTDNNSSKLSTTTDASNAVNVDSSKSTSLGLNLPTINSLTQTTVSTADSKNEQHNLLQSSSTLKSAITFTFSEPLQVGSVLIKDLCVTKNEVDKYKFSAPLNVIVPHSSNCLKVNNTQPKQPQLKEGSCLDALSKSSTLPPTSKLNTTEQTSSNKDATSISSGFGNQFQKSSNEWECETCMIRNKSDKNKCAACETPRKQNSALIQKELKTSTSASVTSAFGHEFKKSSSEWECDTCMIRNKEEKTKCIACETPRKCAVTQSTATFATTKSSFGDAFKPKAGTWECQTCMISNKNEANACIACETKKPWCTNAPRSAVNLTQFKFGITAIDNKNIDADASFKTLAAQQKASKWECDACMTRNDANRTKCACCEQPKPGSTSSESTNTASTKFQFGATATSKFSFGFGTGANAPKEEDLKKEMSSKAKETTQKLAPTSELGLSQPAKTAGGFQFEIKPNVNSTSECKRDEADGDKQVTGYEFGGQKVAEKSTILPPPPSSFAFASRDLTTKAISISSSSPAVASTPSVKFSLPSNTTSTNVYDNDKPKVIALPALGFGTSSATSTTGGFSFGNKIDTNDAALSEEKKNNVDNSAFKAPAAIVTTKNSGFVFGSSTINTSTTVSTPFVSSTSSSTTSTPATTFTTTAAVKPMFSFGTTTSDTKTQATPSFSSFSFGINPTNIAATTANTLFAAVTSTITTTVNTTTKPSLLTSSTSITTPASTNIFGSFGGGAGLSNAAASPIFGSSVNPPANNNLSNVSSSTNNLTSSNSPQFGAFGSKSSSNVFGSFGGGEAKNSTLVKPNGTKPTLPVFGNIVPSSTSQSSLSNSSGFVFGSNNANDAAVVTTASTTSSVTSTSTTWPKNSFIFGSNASATTSIITAASANTSENKEVTKTSVFGTFGSSSTNSNNQQQTSSIFGVQASNNIGSASNATASGPTSFSTNLFSTNSAPAATSIFGANSSGNAATPAPAFGSSPFGGAASSTSATPTFGSTAASGTTFGSFAGSTSNATKSTTEVKKPEAAFSFGIAATTQSTSGGFNFGSSVSTTKPAFNFGGTSTTQQPTFNFTGTNESQSSAKPFQFGATPSAPVFNFNRGIVEGSPNAPFQFNAGAAPVSSNIFAPAPTPGAQTAQQAKRKIRTTIRRVTPR